MMYLVILGISLNLSCPLTKQLRIDLDIKRQDFATQCSLLVPIWKAILKKKKKVEEKKKSITFAYKTY